MCASSSVETNPPRRHGIGSSPGRCARIVSLAAFVAVVFAATTTTSAFQLNMIATHGSSVSRRIRSRSPVAKPLAAPFAPPSIPSLGGGGVTSSLISNLAVAALKVRLASQSSVTCDASGSSSSDLLLRGTVGPVTVRGKGWASELGLTCRAIEATVQRCSLDLGSVISRRKLVLTTPAKGDALIALNGDDFANFIKHPLVKPPTLSGSDFHFLQDGVTIEPSDGSVVFHGEHLGKRWRCTLRRGGKNGAVVSVTPANASDADDAEKMSAQLSEVLSKFFNEMVFELGGTYLSFKDMMVTATKNGSGQQQPNVMLALSITVEKFPSRGLAF